MPEARIFREILDAQLEMVCRFRRDGTILFVNRAYAAPLGQTPDDLTGKNLWQFVTPEDRAGVEDQLRQLTPERTEISIENRFETTTGPRWILWRNHALEFTADGALLVAQSTGVDITERKLLEEQRQLLLDELNHRVRNTLTVVQGMAHQSFRDDREVGDALATFNARLHALASAHTILSGGNWGCADLAQIVRNALAICGEESPRIAIDGPDLSLTPSTAVALALILHELATNALKHGALAHGGGWLSVRWQSAAGRLQLQWEEGGGDTVQPPTRRGFGSRLLESSVERQLRGELSVDFAPTGLRCRMDFPLDPAAAPI